VIYFIFIYLFFLGQDKEFSGKIFCFVFRQSFYHYSSFFNKYIY